MLATTPARTRLDAGLCVSVRGLSGIRSQRGLDRSISLWAACLPSVCEKSSRCRTVASGGGRDAAASARSASARSASARSASARSAARSESSDSSSVGWICSSATEASSSSPEAGGACVLVYGAGDRRRAGKFEQLCHDPNEVYRLASGRVLYGLYGLVLERGHAEAEAVGATLVRCRKVDEPARVERRDFKAKAIEDAEVWEFAARGFANRHCASRKRCWGLGLSGRKRQRRTARRARSGAHDGTL